MKQTTKMNYIFILNYLMPLTANQVIRDVHPDINAAKQTRNPEKVYIERDGGQYFYSTEQPGGLEFKIQALLNGFYGCQNYITLFYSLPEVFAPVHEIAKRVSDANWQLVKDFNKEVDKTDADFNRLFTQPNPLSSFKDFVYQSVCYEILTGKLLWMFNKPQALEDTYKSIVTWSLIPSDASHIVMKKGVDPYTATTISDFVDGYKVSAPGGTRTFTPNQVLPILQLSLSGNCYDLNNVKSHIDGAKAAIKNLLPVYEARGVIYIKRGQMGLWVSRKSDLSGMIALTPGESKQAHEQVNADFGLTGGRATIGVSSVPMDFIKTSMSIDELKPFEETRADAIAIYSCLRVPRHLMPNEDSTNYDNAATDLESFYSNVIIPWGQRYAQAWTTYMKLKDFRRYINADYSHISAAQGNLKTKAETDKLEGTVWLERWQNGACNLNDWIISFGGEKVNEELYTKKIFEMSDVQITKVMMIISKNKMTAPTQPTSNEKIV